MKTIMITAPSSNTGKTTLTLGILRALKNRGLDISSFKTGPDFIDTKYLKMASRKKAGNLDMHMMGRDNIKKSLSLNKGDYAVIEGAMGYFDGIYNTFENSSYDISMELDIPAILVYRPKGEMFSAIPKIKGMVDFSKGRIKAVILNKCSKSTYILLKEQIEKYIGVAVIGYMENDKELSVEESRLGLDESDENAMEEVIEATSKLIEKNIDLDMLINFMKDIEIENFEVEKKYNIKIAIAKDDAFRFHYNENITLLEKMAQIEYFSLLDDINLPKADLVIIGGGYPENYLEDLSNNDSMKSSIREYVENDGYLIAEGAGLMYLSNNIEGKDMVGIFDGNIVLINKLERFGYTIMESENFTMYGNIDTKLVGNEYHKSKIETNLDTVFNVSKPKSKKTWKCGYKYKNVLAYYGHINYLGNIGSLNHLLSYIERG